MRAYSLHLPQLGVQTQSSRTLDLPGAEICDNSGTGSQGASGDRSPFVCGLRDRGQALPLLGLSGLTCKMRHVCNTLTCVQPREHCPCPIVPEAPLPPAQRGPITFLRSNEEARAGRLGFPPQRTATSLCDLGQHTAPLWAFILSASLKGPTL